ncbi:hypothetical protein [Sphingomonas cavernae]|nr:hypothetical protein [Sphingomonas cavernae]
MRPVHADRWRAIAIIARLELRDRRRAFAAEKAKGGEAASLATKDGAAWAAIAADWTYYTTHVRPKAPDVTADDKLGAIDRELQRYDRLANSGGLTPRERRRRAFLEAMRWHAEPRAFGIEFCVAVTIEARRRRATNDNFHTNERNAA